MQIVADLGGVPGRDCRGYCKYCYFKKVKPIEPLGCSSCPPNKIGCSRCGDGVQEAGSEFQQPFTVINQVQSTLMMNPIRDNNHLIIIINYIIYNIIYSIIYSI